MANDNKATVPLEKCDVHDKEKLAVFRYFRSQWIQILNGEDQHAICKQVTELLDADLAFSTINYARKLCEENSLPQCGIIHSFIDSGFIAQQAFAIRRITEDYDGQKRKAVYSIPRIISEIESMRGIITREMYVCVDGDPYESTSHNDFHSDFRHRSFDELSLIEPEKRTRDDLIHADSFRKLRSYLKSSEVIRIYANKVLAHAADPITRKGNEAFCLHDLVVAYKDLITLTNQLSAKLLYSSSHIFLPTYTFNAIENVGNPICPISKLHELKAFWHHRYQELETLERSSN